MNFIIFLPDEMRADSLECYGHPIVKTPQYNRLASEGVRFDKCFVQATACAPSRCSMMTGWYPHVAGHRTLYHLLRPHEPSLFRYLKEAGYHIEWYGGNDMYSEPYLLELFGTGEGLSSSKPIAEDRPSEGGDNPYSEDDPAHYSLLFEPMAGDPEHSSTMRKVQQAIQFLRNRKPGDKPFIMYLPLPLPHPPYTVHEDYYHMYDPDDLPPLRPYGLSNKPEYHELIREYRRLNELPDHFMKKIQAVYLGMIAYVDKTLGNLLDVLDDTGLNSDTAFIAASDHGGWAGDYGLVEKWPNAMEDTQVRVPLIMRAPGGKAGHVVNEPVELFDMMATILDLAGIESKHNHFARSLVPQIQGAPGDPLRAVFTEGGYDTREPHCFEGYPGAKRKAPKSVYNPKLLHQQEKPKSACRSTMIRTMEYKLIRRTGDIHELYDLTKDPRELNNVYEDPSYASVRTELEIRMLDWYIHTSDAVPQDEDSRGLPKQLR